MFGLFNKKKKEDDLVWVNNKGEVTEDSPQERSDRVSPTSITLLDAVENHYIAHDFDFTCFQGDQRQRMETLKTNWTEKVVRLLADEDERIPDNQVKIIQILAKYGAIRAYKPAYTSAARIDHTNGLYCEYFQFPGEVGDYFSGEKFGKLMYELNDLDFIHQKLSVGDKGTEFSGEWVYEQLDIWSE